MNQNYGNSNKTNDTKNTDLSDSRFNKYGKVGGITVNGTKESNLIDKTENKMR